VIVAGFGFRKTASLSSLRSALANAGGTMGATVLAAPDDKCEAACFQALVRETGLPVVAVRPAQLAATTTPTQSDHSHAARQTGSVAEAAALAAAGQHAELIAPRAISEDRLATCALAKENSQ